jgi:hypothetical protein
MHVQKCNARALVLSTLTLYTFMLLQQIRRCQHHQCNTGSPRKPCPRTHLATTELTEPVSSSTISSASCEPVTWPPRSFMRSIKGANSSSDTLPRHQHTSKLFWCCRAACKYHCWHSRPQPHAVQGKRLLVWPVLRRWAGGRSAGYTSAGLVLKSVLEGGDGLYSCNKLAQTCELMHRQADAQ